MDTIKIIGSTTVTAFPDGGLHIDSTLYVNSSTYLPVRMIFHNHGRATQTNGKVLALRGTVQEDIRWLPPTRANLARLSVTIPAGYRRVHFNASSDTSGGIQFFVAGPGN